MEGQTPAPEQAQRGARGAERGARGFGRGGRGGRGGAGRPGGRGGYGKDEWTPMTKLGRLVKAGKVQNLEQIYTFSIPVKEAQIIDKLVAGAGATLSDEVMCIASVQKQTKAGQRTRFKAVVACGDRQGHVGVGTKHAKEVQIAIKGALVNAKVNLVPIRRGYWGAKMGEVHTIPTKVHGKCGSTCVKLIPAPRGTGCVAAQVSKKILNFAGIDDVYTKSTGQTRTRQNFVYALFHALKKTYTYLTPDLWPQTKLADSPFVEHAQWLQDYKTEKRQGDRRGRGRGGPRGRGGRGQSRGRGGPRQQA